MHDLQQYVMAQSQEETPTPPVDITMTTFIQPVLMGREQRRYTVRLTMTSAIDLDWSVGWSGKGAFLLMLSLKGRPK